MAPVYSEFAVPLDREGCGSVHAVAYQPSTKSSIQGVLVWHHGYAEHCGRYKTGETPSSSPSTTHNNAGRGRGCSNLPPRERSMSAVG
jgi:hypothetical protein